MLPFCCFLLKCESDFFFEKKSQGLKKNLMANPNCSTVLASYADWLSNNPEQEGKRPHPLLFSGPNCSGFTWPPFDEVPIENTFEPTPFAPSFGSLYVPAYWEVTLLQPDYARLICSSYQPLLITDTTSFFWNALYVNFPSGFPDCVLGTPGNLERNIGITTKDHVGQVMMRSIVPRTDPAIPYTSDCWAFDMCNSIITTPDVTSYSQGSLECDGLMTDFCKSTSGYTCRTNSRAGESNMKLPECSCLQDEIDIQNTFCFPGNTAAQCQDAGQFQQFVPVVCFGKTCAADNGYKFNRMLNANCQTTLCQQIVEVIGDSISIDAQSVLYCGTKPLSVTPSITPFVTPTSSNDNNANAWIYLLIVVGLVALLVLFPLGILLFKRSKEKELEKDGNEIKLKQFGVNL